VVDALVRKGYVERTTDLEDGRAVSLRVTTAGRRLYNRINDELVAEQVELLRGLDPAARAGAIEVLNRLARLAEARFFRSGRTSRPCVIAVGQKSTRDCS